MSPTGIFAVLLLALIVDWMSIGPDSIRDRVAFCLALPAIHAGWDGSTADKYTVSFLSAFIDQVKLTGNARVAQASTSIILGIGVGALAIYCLGCLAPSRAATRLGPWAQLAFKGRAGTGRGAAAAAPAAAGGGRYRLNGRLWWCASGLGMLGDIPNGLVGAVINGGIVGLTHLVAPLPNLLFGAT